MSKAEEKKGEEPKREEIPPTASFDSSVPGLGGQIGPYKLLRILGEGGYGIVYLAERYRPVKRRVAPKIIKPGTVLK